MVGQARFMTVQRDSMMKNTFHLLKQIRQVVNHDGVLAQ